VIGAPSTYQSIALFHHALKLWRQRQHLRSETAILSPREDCEWDSVDCEFYPLLVWILETRYEQPSSWVSLNGNDRVLVDLLRSYNASSTVPYHHRLQFQLQHMSRDQLQQNRDQTSGRDEMLIDFSSWSPSGKYNLFPSNFKLPIYHTGQFLCLRWVIYLNVWMIV
jgi:hypothetical protein